MTWPRALRPASRGAPAERDSGCGPGGARRPLPRLYFKQTFTFPASSPPGSLPGAGDGGGVGCVSPLLHKRAPRRGPGSGGYFWEQLRGSDGLVRAALTFLPAGEESGTGQDGTGRAAAGRGRVAGSGPPSLPPPRGSGPPSVPVPRGRLPGRPMPVPAGQVPARSGCPDGGPGARPALLPSLSSNFSLLPCPSSSAGPGEAGAAAPGAQPVASGDAGAPERCPWERCPAEGHRRAP